MRMDGNSMGNGFGGVWFIPIGPQREFINFALRLDFSPRLDQCAWAARMSPKAALDLYLRPARCTVRARMDRGRTL